MASALNIQGVGFMLKGNYNQALAYHKKGLKMKEEIGDKKGMASSYINIGIIYKDLGNYEQSLFYYKKSLKIDKETGNQMGMSYCLCNIGIIYLNQRNYVQALSYFGECLQSAKETGDKKGMAFSYMNMGNIYGDKGNYEQALDYYKKSLQINEELDDKMGIADIYSNIGIIYSKQDRYEQALLYYQKSFKIDEAAGDKKGMVNSYIDIGTISFKQDILPQALFYGKIALDLAQKLGVVIETKRASNLLYDVYKKTGQSAKALKMHELYIKMNDSINSIENKEAAIKLEYQHAYEKEQALADAKHQEQMSLSAEREKRQQLIAYSAGGGLVMVLLFAFFILNRLQLTHRQKKVIEQQKELVEEQKKDITDSIHYAENIQKALLPSAQELSLIPDGFILFQPKDIVSGDFYWMQHHKDKVYFAACDCTGHGVPGAFMSMIGSSLLDEAVVEKGITKPNEIFYEVRKGFINALKQTRETQKDGMDAVLIAWDKKSTLQVATAYSPVIIIRNGEIQELKPDRQPVGFHTGEQKPFTHHELKLEKGDTLYIFSDGYPDQFGGPKDKKFMMKNFKKLLLSIQEASMNEQKTILETTMAEWRGDSEQVDDILVMGVRF